MGILKNTKVNPRVLKNEADYEEALKALGELMDLQPEPDSDEAIRLELMAHLIQDYESRHHAIAPPDPIEAIKFRMEQQGLKPSDLVPFLGSRSRVSEVLSKKRPLTLSMIRALKEGLGIPAESLIQESNQHINGGDEFDWFQLPFKEMRRRGWISRRPRTASEARDVALDWIAPLKQTEYAALYRHRGHVRSKHSMDWNALFAWTLRVASKALRQSVEGSFDPSILTGQFLGELSHISVFESGPKLAQEFLGKHGIALVIEPHLPRTYLDGAAILCRGKLPVVALTVRYDRIDSFWFCLMHELVHLGRHLGDGAQPFYDDLDSDDAVDPREREADELAGEALVPTDAWKASPASKLRTPEAAAHLAQRLRIHPAIVAGKVRYQSKQFRLLSNLVGQGQVRRWFPEVSW